MDAITPYGFVLWGQTLLALAALGLAGGWVLWPFRDSNRPYLWLAAPLAGLPALGLALLGLYYGLGLGLVPSLILGWHGLSATTGACLLRALFEAKASRRAGSGGLLRGDGGDKPRRSLSLTALAVLAAGSLGATYYCNHASLRAGEPTLSCYEGSDQFGYSMIGDWLRHHSGRQRPQPSRLLDTLPYANLHLEGSRHAAFLLTASSATVRGTTCVFSYDWATGVALAAALFGLGGLYASGPVGLWLLLAAAATSAWTVLTRTGFLGKTLAYPGCLLLCFLYLEAWGRPSWGRVLATCLVAPGVAFSINPILPPLVLGGLLAGLLVGLVAQRAAGCIPAVFDEDSGREGRCSPPSVGWRSCARAVALYLAVAGPAFLFHRLNYSSSGYPPYPYPWGLVIPASLDLDHPALRLIADTLMGKLLLALLAANGLLLVAAWRQRNLPAQALLLAGGLVPVARLLGLTQVYGFHGLLYPMTAAGAVLLLDRSGRSSGKLWPGGAAVLLAVVLVGLHVPSAYLSGKRYLTRTHACFPLVYKQSEMGKLRALVRGQRLDLCLGDVHDAHMVLVELGGRGTPINLLSPSWDVSLKNWALYVGYTVPPLPPKARYQIVERSAYAPPGTVRDRSDHFQLIEDGTAITFRTVQSPQLMTQDENRRPGFWQGHAPTAVEICNGTGHTANVHFLAEGRPGPAVADLSRRIVRYRFGNRQGMALLGPTGWQLDVPLRLPPGSHVLSLSAEDGPAPLRSGAAEPLLRLTNLRLE